MSGTMLTFDEFKAELARHRLNVVSCEDVSGIFAAVVNLPGLAVTVVVQHEHRHWYRSWTAYPHRRSEYPGEHGTGNTLAEALDVWLRRRERHARGVLCEVELMRAAPAEEGKE